jgi:hypothetical protein
MSPVEDNSATARQFDDRNRLYLGAYNVVAVWHDAWSIHTQRPSKG